MKIVELNKTSTKYLDQLIEVRELKVAKDKVSKFISNPQNHAYFALDGEKVAAFVWGYTLERLDADPMMFVYSVDVIESYRRQGVGKEIVSKFIEYAENHGYIRTFLIADKDNLPANKLYSSLGGELHEDKVLYIFND